MEGRPSQDTSNLLRDYNFEDSDRFDWFQSKYLADESRLSKYDIDRESSKTKKDV